jgi:tetratricopeptide (TPR) repeat protein
MGLGTILCCLALGLLGPGAPCASGDADNILCLRDGRIVEGVKMQQLDEGMQLFFANGEIFVPQDLILDAVISGDTTFVPETEEEKEKFAKGMVPFEGRWYSIKQRERLIQKRLTERRSMIDDIKEHSVWRNRRIEKTKHFQFEYTLPQHTFDRYRDLMEAYFTAFAKQWRVKQPRDLGKLTVCFYIDRESFEQIGGAGRGVLGYFRFVKPLDLNFYNDRLDPELTEAVMFHEANHYLQKLINVNFKMPHWPGESLAEYYGASTYDLETKKLTIGLIQEGRLTEIQTDIAAGEMMSLDKLITTDGMYDHYNWGWSLVHYCMNEKKFAKKFQKYVMGLANDKGIKREVSGFGADVLKTVDGSELLRAFKDYLDLEDDGDYRDFERDWHQYVMDKLELVTSRGYEKAAFAAMSTYPSRPIRARRLFKTAIEKGTENPLTFHRYAQLLRQDGKHGEAIKMWERAIGYDPLNPTFYRSMAYALRAKGKKDEAKRLIALAKEIDPDNPYVEIDLIGLEDEDDDS